MLFLPLSLKTISTVRCWCSSSLNCPVGSAAHSHQTFASNYAVLTVYHTNIWIDSLPTHYFTHMYHHNHLLNLMTVTLCVQDLHFGVRILFWMLPFYSNFVCTHAVHLYSICERDFQIISFKILAIQHRASGMKYWKKKMMGQTDILMKTTTKQYFPVDV